MAEISVEISANIAQVQKALKTVKGDLKDMGAAADGSVGKLNKPLASATQSVNKLGKATAVNANPALQEFSRVIQDAPFGIMGVGNNITQLVGNFGNLSKSAGGAGAALKAMLGSLAGPGGVLLAVSTAVTVLTVFGDKIFNTKSKAEELAEATKKAAEALESYVDALVGVERATLKGKQAAAEEITTLRLLRGQIENTTLTTEERKDGILKLRKEFPAYFQDVKDEKLLNGQAATSYDNLTNSIIKRAKATAAQDLLVKNAKKEIIIADQLDKLNDKIIDKQKELEDAKQKDSKASTNVLVGGAGSYNAKLVEQGVIQQGINNLTEDQIGLQKKLGEISEQNAKLSAFVTANVIVEPKEVKLDLSKAKLSYNRDATKFPSPTAEMASIFGLDPESQKILEQKAVELAERVSKALTIKEIPPPKLEAFQERMAELVDSVNGLANSGIMDVFDSIGQNIGDALTEGGNILSAVGKGIIQAMGQFLSRMGSMLVEYGTLAVLKGKLDLAILAGGPVSIGAGLAAIAVGIALQAAGTAIGNATSKGSTGTAGSSVGGQGSRGSSISSGAGGSSFGVSGNENGRVVFEIAGTKLVGVLSRTLDRNSRLGGQLSLS